MPFLRILLFFDFFSRPQRAPSYAGVPIVFNRELLGVLACYATEGNSFHAHEVARLAALAGQIATAIYNARLYQRSLTQGTAEKSILAGAMRAS